MVGAATSSTAVRGCGQRGQQRWHHRRVMEESRWVKRQVQSLLTGCNEHFLMLNLWVTVSSKIYG
jgi:hypothetical protein